MITNIEQTIQTINHYYSISVVLQVVAVLMIITAIVLWFFLDVPHAFSVFFGLRSKKALRRIREHAQEGHDKTSRSLKRINAAISWGFPSKELSNNTTTILSRTDSVNREESTVVLPRADFIIKKRLIQTGTKEEIA